MKKKTTRKGAKRETVVIREGGSRVIEPKTKPEPKTEKPEDLKDA